MRFTPSRSPEKHTKISSINATHLMSQEETEAFVAQTQREPTIPDRIRDERLVQISQAMKQMQQQIQEENAAARRNAAQLIDTPYGITRVRIVPMPSQDRP